MRNYPEIVSPVLWTVVILNKSFFLTFTLCRLYHEKYVLICEGHIHVYEVKPTCTKLNVYI